ncbi:MAG TPA: hypothetical protein VFW28_03850 [Micropepsaceae bacterium]|nr:hypothetical protein [Micropepsaceae bacterium]
MVKLRRRNLSIVIGLAATLAAASAAAAPTCQTAKGETIKCGISGAMPVGWRLSADQKYDRADQDASGVFQWLQAICAVGIVFAILAAMPDFESTQPGEWDKEEDDRR